jgi:hypothetical protein
VLRATGGHREVRLFTKKCGDTERCFATERCSDTEWFAETPGDTEW